MDAYCRVKAIYPREATLNLLWALAGALAGKPWHAVDAATKAALKQELARNDRTATRDGRVKPGHGAMRPR